ncbi:hypothetical protein Taro_049282 [Colocasia esculenta]|uniref:Uncharacterized protein n=1 Tax=Colocasia esculenta TaxID=4460 RepID=A0A843XAI5_COLES|nr:hypothetical protein [Colocasia esculenta]
MILEVAPTGSRDGSRYIAVCAIMASRGGSHSVAVCSVWHLVPALLDGQCRQDSRGGLYRLKRWLPLCIILRHYGLKRWLP